MILIAEIRILPSLSTVLRDEVKATSESFSKRSLGINTPLQSANVSEFSFKRDDQFYKIDATHQ